MSIQTLINVLRDIEVDARMSKDLAQRAAEDTANPTQGLLDELETSTRNTLVGINQALRQAEQIKAAAEEEESK